MRSRDYSTIGVETNTRRCHGSTNAWSGLARNTVQQPQQPGPLHVIDDSRMMLLLQQQQQQQQQQETATRATRAALPVYGWSLERHWRLRNDSFHDQ